MVLNEVILDGTALDEVSLNDAALDHAPEEAACFSMASTLHEIAFRFGVTGGSYNLFLILISTFSGRMLAVIH